MKLTQEDSGAKRTVRVGERIDIELGENPTTGYRWHVDVDSTRLQLTEDRYEGPQRPVGAGGTRCLSFASLQPGPVRLLIVKRRSWDEDSAVAQFEVALDIAPD